MKMITFYICFFVAACHAQEIKPLYNHLPLSQIIDSFQIDKSTLLFLIDKSDYRLYIKTKGIVLKEYPVVFGKNMSNDKLMQGDRCTPEGTFRMLSKYPHKSWSKFIWINYPNENSWKKHNDAKLSGRIPQNAKIGGEVGIHGVPEGMDFLVDTRYNWTLGCISMKNKDVNEVYPFVLKNTPIEIRK